MSTDYNYPPPPLFTDEESAAIGEAFDKTFTSSPRQYIDKQGDVWTVQGDGTFALDDDDDEVWEYKNLNRVFGPLTPVDDEHEDDNEIDARTMETLVAAARDLINAVDDYREKSTTPDYYRFPCGAQVIEVSRYLTSNAGQAVQYLARSSRIDGVTKGDPLPDLYKARDMLADEIERLELAADRANEAA